MLLEAGSIVNRDEELELGKAERRALISAAVAAAVAEFCASRARPHGATHAKAAQPGRASASTIAR